MKTYSRFTNLLKPKLRLNSKMRGLSFRFIENFILSYLSKPVTINSKPAVIFAPHQDDETLGCGGMIALKRKYGIPVSVVFVTDGKQSHGQNYAHSSDLSKVRRQEAVKALNILGVGSSEIYFLEQPDGSLHDQTSQERQNLIDKLIELLKTLKPEEIYVPHRRDQHLDHEATYKLVSDAVRSSGIKVEVLQYPIWLFWQSLIHWKLEFHDLLGARKLLVSSVQQQKKDALVAYRSQHSILPPEFLINFMKSYEIFFKP